MLGKRVEVSTLWKYGKVSTPRKHGEWSCLICKGDGTNPFSFFLFINGQSSQPLSSSDPSQTSTHYWLSSSPHLSSFPFIALALFTGSSEKKKICQKGFLITAHYPKQSDLSQTRTY
ncbi:hypothetical protein CMV_004995 [Castanea mollissima]|uniref:Uncharacterized protein n=1 Tax=Castanea mollissima TaxID=60419 RepID=A0A8J4RKU1_9ROSI|nr:hypothetical protein CMV_004995 [Castanea mollissima]